MPTCIYCGEKDLNWHGTAKGKRLGRDGVLHNCRVYHRLRFAEKYQQQCHDHMKSNGLTFKNLKGTGFLTGPENK